MCVGVAVCRMKPERALEYRNLIFGTNLLAVLINIVCKRNLKSNERPVCFHVAQKLIVLRNFSITADLFEIIKLLFVGVVY